MGDRRFEKPYRRVAHATDKAEALRRLTDDEVIQALAHARHGEDQVLSNVLATEAMNRMRRSRLALRYLGEGVLTIDRTGLIVDANTTALTMLGYASEELAGRDLHDTLHPRDEAGRCIPRESCVPLRAFLAGKDYAFDALPFTRRDGSRILVSGIYAPYRGEDGHDGGGVVAFRDVTQDAQQQRVEQAALRASASRLRALVEQSPHAIQIFAPNGEARDANAQWEAMWGISREDARGRNILRDPQFEAMGLAQDVARAFRGERVELPLARYHFGAGASDGASGSRWLKSVLYPVLDDEGRVQEVVLASADVTGDMKAREEAQASNELYRMLVEGVRDYAIFMLDPQGHVMSWNLGAERLKGWRAEEIIGRHFSTFYTHEDRARNLPQTVLARATRDGSAEAEGWRVRKDGTHFWASVVVTALRRPDGELRGFAKVTRDLTERRKAEEALRVSGERYRRLVERSPAPMAVHAGGRILFANHATAQLMGVAGPEDLLGRNVMEFVHPESRAIIIERMRQSATSSEPLPPAAEKLVRPDGQTVEVETVALPIDYEGMRAVQLILRDITHQKHEERRLRETAEELERRVRERTLQLEQAVRDMETFTNSASHDLRAPLRGVEELTRALEEDFAPQLGEEGRRLVHAARRENQKATRLVRALLAFARSGRGQIQRDWVDVSALAREIAEEIRQRHPERRTQWDIQEGMTAWADDGLLRIALNNLMSNASKYSDKAPEPRVRVEAARDGEGTTLRVIDNGVGFPEAEAYRLFGAFNRLSSAQGYEGTGLGLVAVERIVSRHGGRAWGEPRPEGGAIFSIMLPGPEA